MTTPASRRTSKSFALPFEGHSNDYALREYGVTDKELDRFLKRMHTQIARERKAGTIKRYTGDLEADIAD